MVRLLVSIAGAYCIILLLLYIFQRNLIYFPFTLDEMPPPPQGMQEIKLVTSDKLSLTSWYCPPSQPDKPTIVYFHGNAGHIGMRSMLIQPYLNMGYGVLLLTYRGYSGNPGKPSEEGLYRDARAAMEYVKQNRFIVLYGESIGTAVAIQMALEYPVRALVLQAPFTSLADVGQYHYPVFPIKLLLKDTFNVAEKAKRIHIPVLILHGRSDTIIPLALSAKLFEAFPGSKKIEYIPNRGHNDLFEPARVIEFINSASVL